MTASTERMHIVLQGTVQGVGFPPTIYRMAQTLHLAGFVRNAGAGVEIEIEGSPEQVQKFLHRLTTERPRTAVVVSEEVSRIVPTGRPWFEILQSEGLP